MADVRHSRTHAQGRKCGRVANTAEPEGTRRLCSHSVLSMHLRRSPRQGATEAAGGLGCLSLSLESLIVSILNLVESRRIEPKLVKRSELESSRILTRLLAIGRLSRAHCACHYQRKPVYSTRIWSGRVESSRIESNRCVSAGRSARSPALARPCQPEWKLRRRATAAASSTSTTAVDLSGLVLIQASAQQAQHAVARQSRPVHFNVPSHRTRCASALFLSG